MNFVIIEASKKDAKMWLDLAKKTGSKAKSISSDDMEDMVLAKMIEEGLNTENVSRSEIMKVLGK